MAIHRRMDDLIAEWEGIALDILRTTGLEPPVDAFVLAECCGLEVRYMPGARARLDGETIWLGARAVYPHELVAHEIGHWALRRGGVEDDEIGVWWIAALLFRKPTVWFRTRAVEPPSEEWSLAATVARLALRHDGTPFEPPPGSFSPVCADARGSSVRLFSASGSSVSITLT